MEPPLFEKFYLSNPSESVCAGRKDVSCSLSGELLFRDVPRGTFDAINTYTHLLQKWNGAINLVSPYTLPHIWSRHILDSAQLFPLIPQKATIADMGSGAGFPGLVLAMMGKKTLTLIEADERKCLFLQEVADTTDTQVTIVNQRIESLVPPLTFDVLISRGFASIEKTLALSALMRSSQTIYIFLKGAKGQQEVHRARMRWDFKSVFYPSSTHPQGQIITLSEVFKKK